MWFESITVTLSSENARLLFYNGGQRDLLGKTIMYLNWQLAHFSSSKMKSETVFVFALGWAGSWMKRVRPPLTWKVLIWIIQTPRVRFLQRHKKRKLCWFFLSPVVAVCWSKAWTNNQQRLGRQARQNFASHILLQLSYLVLPFLTVARPPTPVKDDYVF